MKRRTPGRIAAALMALAVSSSASSSVTCIAPDPLCAVVIVGGIVTGLARAEQESDAGTARKEAVSRDERRGTRLPDRGASRHSRPSTGVIRR